jgi:hypothetical protein
MGHIISVGNYNSTIEKRVEIQLSSNTCLKARLEGKGDDMERMTKILLVLKAVKKNTQEE